MSKRINTSKCNKKANNNKDTNSNDNNKALKDKYNFIINQNNTFNQDIRINIMLDSSSPYFLNYNYQSNEANPIKCIRAIKIITKKNPKFSKY